MQANVCNVTVVLHILRRLCFPEWRLHYTLNDTLYVPGFVVSECNPPRRIRLPATTFCSYAYFVSFCYVSQLISFSTNKGTLEVLLSTPLCKSSCSFSNVKYYDTLLTLVFFVSLFSPSFLLFFSVGSSVRRYIRHCTL